MGLDQKIFELTNLKKFKKISEIDVWNKYSIFDFTDGIGIATMMVQHLPEEYFDKKRLEKDGFRTVKEFRKFHELQGWFETHYKIKNLGKVMLTINNIDKLLSDVDNKKLIRAEGPLYGDHDASNEDFNELKQTLQSIKDDVKQGRKFFYTCWY